MSKYIVQGYAAGKLYDFIYELFTGLDPARKRLGDNLHYIYLISPSDFKLDRHRKLWRELQVKLNGKTKNIGTKKFPIDQLTVQNKTIEWALKSIWNIYYECCIDEP